MRTKIAVPSTYTVLGVFAAIVFAIIAGPALCVVLSIIANAVFI